MNKVLNILYRTLIVILGILLVGLVFYMGQNVYADLTHSKPLIRLYTIISPSMEPNVNIYDIVIVKKVKKTSDIKKGDIITFYSKYLINGEYTVTHRVFDIKKENGKTLYETKGDNNPIKDDGYRELSDIEGKVIKVIPGFGKVQAFIASFAGWFLVILIPALIMIIIDIIKIIKVGRINKRMQKVQSIDVSKYREQELDKKIIASIEAIEKTEEENNKWKS